MAEKSKNRRYSDDAVKWAGIGAGAALGSAALAAAVLYVARARDREEANKTPAKVIEAED